MRILLLGRDGQVGWELQRALAPVGEVVATGLGGSAPVLDLTDEAALRATVAAVMPAVIVNAVAYTNVDQAEGDAALAARIKIGRAHV